jgi:hypothetical protein
MVTLSGPEKALAQAMVARAAIAEPGDVQGYIGQFDAQINAMINNNLTFLALQTRVQNVSQATQLAANVAQADSDSKLSAVRNVRA